MVRATVRIIFIEEGSTGYIIIYNLSNKQPEFNDMQ